MSIKFIHNTLQKDKNVISNYHFHHQHLHQFSPANSSPFHLVTPKILKTRIHGDIYMFILIKRILCIGANYVNVLQVIGLEGHIVEG